MKPQEPHDFEYDIRDQSGDEDHRRPTQTRTLVISVALVIAVVVIAIIWSASQADAPTTSTSTTTTSTPAAPTPTTVWKRTPPPREPTYATMDEWMRGTFHGGRGPLDDHASALIEANSDTDLEGLLVECQALSEAVESSQDIQPMPDAELDALWQDYLHYLWSSSALCEAAITGDTTSWQLSLAGDEIDKAVSARIALDNEMAGR